MSKSTAFIIAALAFCFGLFAGVLVMSSQVEEYKKEKKQAEAAHVITKAEIAREVAVLKEKLSKGTKANTVEKSQLHKESVTVVEEEQWKEVARWTGKGAKSTETFHISSRTWRISWATRPGEYAEYGLGLLQICVYNSDGSLFDIAANVGVVGGEDIDSSVMHGSGDYYLTINAVQPYVVVVETK